MRSSTESKQEKHRVTHRMAPGHGRWAVGGGGGRGWPGRRLGLRSGAWRRVSVGRASGSVGRLQPPTAYAPEEDEASSSPWVSLKRTRTPREPRRRFVLEAFVGTGSYPPTVEDRSRRPVFVDRSASLVAGRSSGAVTGGCNTSQRRRGAFTRSKAVLSNLIRLSTSNELGEVQSEPQPRALPAKVAAALHDTAEPAQADRESAASGRNG